MGTEYKAGYCPACGRWNGSPPGGVIFIAVTSIVNASIFILVGLFFVLFSEKSKVDALGLSLSIVLLVLGGGYLIVAVNLLRLREWALIVYRVNLIIGIVAVSGLFVFGLTQGFDIFSLINTIVSIVWCGFLLSYLRSKSHLFSQRSTVTTRENTARVCANCGNAELTSLDRVCPKCKKALA